MPTPPATGVYGLAIDGLSSVGTALPAPEPGWPALQLRRTGVAGPAPRRAIDAERAVLPYRGDGWATVSRAARTATIHRRGPVGDDELLHPLLSPVAAVCARWDGREALHGGAVVGRDGAWAVLAGRNGGKSTAVAALALAGHPLVADDLIVVDGDRALAGPPCVDLRPSAVELLGVGDRVRPVRGGLRSRLHATRAPTTVPLAGLVFLEWDEERSCSRIRGSATLARLSACRASGLEAPTAARSLALASLPAWVVARTPASPYRDTLETVQSVLAGSAG